MDGRSHDDAAADEVDLGDEDGSLVVLVLTQRGQRLLLSDGDGQQQVSVHLCGGEVLPFQSLEGGEIIVVGHVVDDVLDGVALLPLDPDLAVVGVCLQLASKGAILAQSDLEAILEGLDNLGPVCASIELVGELIRS